jgi:hypothetical protein
MDAFGRLEISRMKGDKLEVLGKHNDGSTDGYAPGQKEDDPQKKWKQYFSEVRELQKRETDALGLERREQGGIFGCVGKRKCREIVLSLEPGRVV